MTNSEMIGKMQMIAISGPTHDQQSVFDWTLQENTACKGHNPLGHPKRFDFEPVLVDIWAHPYQGPRLHQGASVDKILDTLATSIWDEWHSESNQWHSDTEIDY